MRCTDDVIFLSKNASSSLPANPSYSYVYLNGPHLLQVGYNTSLHRLVPLAKLAREQIYNVLLILLIVEVGHDLMIFSFMHVLANSPMCFVLSHTLICPLPAACARIGFHILHETNKNGIPGPMASQSLFS